MKKITGFLLLLAGSVSFAFAGGVHVPEIDAATGVAALALLSGGLLILRARRKP